MIRFTPVLLLVLIFTAAVFAQDGAPACANFTRADVVFAGRIVAIENAQKSEDLPAGTKKIRFQVTNNFKGADNQTFTIFAGVDRPMKKGQNWIVFAANDIVYKNFTIIGGGILDPATSAASINELNTIATSNTFGSVGGRIVATMSSEEFASATVTVFNGSKSVSVKPDSSGVFKFPAPDGGKFRVEIKFPFLASINWPDTLLGVNYEKGPPTVFGYDVKTNPGDCSYVEVTASK